MYEPVGPYLVLVNATQNITREFILSCVRVNSALENNKFGMNGCVVRDIV